MKIGMKVLHKISREECKLKEIRPGEVEGSCPLYVFERKQGDLAFLIYTSETELESTYFFLVAPHPTVHDVNRKKNRKTRVKVAQPALDSRVFVEDEYASIT